MACVLGIDGGGTKTICCVMDLDGAVRGRGTSGCSNFNSVGVESAQEAVQTAITLALEEAGLGRDAVSAVCMGMAGVDRPGDVDVVRPWVSSFFAGQAIQLAIHNDAVTALASGTGGVLEGCVLIAGTGTIAFGMRAGGRRARSSGWGPLFADGGSGYDIASRALAAAARSHDGRGPATALLPALMTHLGVATPEDLIPWAYKEHNWARIAALAPLVLASAADGDAVAGAILEAAAIELAAAAAAAAAQLGYLTPAAVTGIVLGTPACEGEPFSLVLAGGLLASGTSFTTRVQRCLAKTFPLAKPVLPSVEPAVAAATLALNNCKSSPP